MLHRLRVIFPETLGPFKLSRAGGPDEPREAELPESLGRSILTNWRFYFVATRD
jgi:hypothetical protein